MPASRARRVRPAGPVVHGSDLLPIAFTEASLAILVRNVVQVQERLRRPIAVENLSAYVSLSRTTTIAEPQFLAELARRSGCTLLLDLNNLMVNALNAGVHDPLAALLCLRRCAAARQPSPRSTSPATAKPRRHRHRRPRQPRAAGRVAALPPRASRASVPCRR